MGERVLGIIYISTYLNERWAFGNYFGVLDGFRHDNRAKWFLNAVSQKLRRMMGRRFDGILFEIEKIDMDCLRKALLRGRIAGTKSEADVIENFKRLRRLYLYQKLLKAYVFLGSNGEPLPYWQPALTKPLAPPNQKEFLLMFLPENKIGISFNTSDAIRFIYDKIYKDAYGETGAVEIEGFNEYILSLSRSVEEKADGSYLGKLKIDHGLYFGLTKIAHKEGIGARLSL